MPTNGAKSSEPTDDPQGDKPRAAKTRSTTSPSAMSATPSSSTPPTPLRDRLPQALKPFSDKEVQTKPGRGGSPPLKYVSHGSVTKRLLELDPLYGLEVKETFVFKDGQGRLHCEGVLVALSFTDEDGRVHVIEEFGGAQRVGIDQKGRTDGFATEAKNALSDAIKRAGMRRGIALGVWEELVDAAYDEDIYPERTELAEDRSQPTTKAHEAAVASGERISDRQVQWLKRQTARLGYTFEWLDGVCVADHGAHLTALSADQAKIVNAYLDELIDAQEEHAAGEAAAAMGEGPKAPAPTTGGTRSTGSNGTNGATGGITEKQLTKLWIEAGERGMSKADVHQFTYEVFGKESTKELTKMEGSTVIEWLLEQPKKERQENLIPAGDLPPIDEEWIYNTP
jgi:hypothetical protein